MRTLVTLGRATREAVKIRVRQPLKRLFAVVPEGLQIRSEVLDLLQDELNVKAVEFLASADGLITLAREAELQGSGLEIRERNRTCRHRDSGTSEAQLQAHTAGDPVSIEVAGRTARARSRRSDGRRRVQGGVGRAIRERVHRCSRPDPG